MGKLNRILLPPHEIVAEETKDYGGTVARVRLNLDFPAVELALDEDQWEMGGHFLGTPAEAVRLGVALIVAAGRLAEEIAEHDEEEGE